MRPLLVLLLLLAPLSLVFSQINLIPQGASGWKYLDTGSNQGTSWTSLAFNDTAWASGTAQLGYGDGDENTTVSFGPDPNNKYVTTYFRHTFNIPDPSLYAALSLQLLRDDGAVVHINGTQVHSSNMPAAPYTYLTLAASTIGGSGEDTFEVTLLNTNTLVAGTNVISVEIHQRAVDSSDMSFDLQLDGTDYLPVTMISPGAFWKYLDLGVYPGSSWMNASFNDAGWASGIAQLGYGDSDENTVVGFGPDASNKYITTYFRHTFLTTGIDQHAGLLLRLLRDDGAVVYLNGQELHRSNMPVGAINPNTLAASTISGSSEDVFSEILLQTDLLLEGANVVAVEIHQRRVTSSDISFDLELRSSNQSPPIVRKHPYMVYTDAADEIRVLWQFHSESGATLEWGPDTSYGLGSVNSLEVNSFHQHGVTLSGLTAGQRYYYRMTVDQESYPGSFRTRADTSSEALRFHIYGDSRALPNIHNQIAQTINAQVASDPTWQNFVFDLGDLVNAGDEDALWDEFLFNPANADLSHLMANMPFLTCMGNHEQSGVLYERYFPNPYAADRYWSFDSGPVHISVVDQYVPYGLGSAQLAWLEADLANSDSPWKFVCLHEPAWSAGGHGNDVTTQTAIQPLLEQYGVQILFAGHNHYYSRAQVNSVTHITTGGAGSSLYTPDPGFPNIQVVSQSYHYCTVDIQGAHLSMDVRTPEGLLIENFQLDLPLETPVLTASPVGSDSLLLQWDPVFGASSYELNSSATAFGTFTADSVMTDTFLVLPASSDSRHFFRVKALTN